MDQYQEPTLREIAEEANKVKADAERKETEKQIETVLSFLRKKAAQGLFEAEYSGSLSLEARQKLSKGRHQLKFEAGASTALGGPPGGAWLIKW
jgi:vacuolar-type H+-ATPase subunit E/Vma4